MENKIVKSYYTKTHSSGIVECILNTFEKWIDYDICYYDKKLEIIGSIDDKYVTESFDLEMNEKMKYTRMERQEKDQIIIYFIPFNLIGKEQWLKD